MELRPQSMARVPWSGRGLNGGNKQAPCHIRPQLFEVTGVPCINPVGIGLKSTCRDRRILYRAADYPAGCGIPDDGKALCTLKANQPKPARDVLKKPHRLIRRSAVGCRNARQRRVNLGKTVRSTTCRLRVAPDKEVHTGSVMRVVSQKNRYQCRCVGEDAHLKRSERREIAFTSNRLQRVVDHRSRQRLSGAQHCDAMFFD